DNLGRVTSLDNSGTVNMPHVVLASTYDAMNDRTQLTATVAGTADFLNAYTYDADQNLLSATQEGQTGGNGVAPKGVGYSYNLDGQITGLLNFDPTTSSPHPDIAYGTLSYDSGNRLTQIDYTHAGTTTLDDMSWAYDSANRVTSFTSNVDGTASYSYDSINELTAATYTGTNQPANESHSFDKNGNVTNTGYTTGTNNQLTSDGTFDYTYDHEGNRVSRTRISSAPANDYLTTYTYDYRDRLTDVDYYNKSSVLTGHVHYVYDVYDHLIGTEIDPTGGGTYTSSQWYSLDITADPNAPALPVLQFDGSGNETYRFLNGPTTSGVDAVMAQEGITTQGSAGTTDYMLADNLGSVRDVVNTSSAVVDHIVYNSFGQVAYESNSAIAHWAGFAGYHTDAMTGLDYADHRWFDPAVGRWISEDPLGFGGGDTNVSRYVGNGTTNGVDPTGLMDLIPPDVRPKGTQPISPGSPFAGPYDPPIGSTPPAPGGLLGAGPQPGGDTGYPIGPGSLGGGTGRPPSVANGGVNPGGKPVAPPVPAGGFLGGCAFGGGDIGSGSIVNGGSAGGGNATGSPGGPSTPGGAGSPGVGGGVGVGGPAPGPFNGGGLPLSGGFGGGTSGGPNNGNSGGPPSGGGELQELGFEDFLQWMEALETQGLNGLTFGVGFVGPWGTQWQLGAHIGQGADGQPEAMGGILGTRPLQ
ncbi:MAG TPA: RHS repeat-associated core domain-containing protein, partial [Pirellulales bacterium]|nr:RHS repeat-associated core domain-containing protein [Pirellulales bacterium]